MSDTLFIDNEDIARAVESIANPREALVGEGKKFKTDDDLARGKLHSDLFIEKQNVELAQERARRAQVEAELEALRNRGTEALEVVNRNVIATQTNNTNESAPKMFTQEDVQKIVKETLQSDREVEARRRNVNTVKNELQKTWGTDYAAKLKEAANEFGGEQEISRMIETNPKALLKLIGVKESTTETPAKSSLFSTPPVSTIRPNLGSGTTEKGASYFAKQRKEARDSYFTGEAFSERLEAISRLGDDYFKK